MNKAWDHHKGGRDTWISWLTDVMREALRLAKPGAHAFVWALPRTSGWTHRAIEDAGWEVRDCATHIFGSGFPKSKNLDGEWEGWGTALKPAAEFWYLARKPLAAKNLAANVTAWGVGGLNIDGCRIGTDEELSFGSREIGVNGIYSPIAKDRQTEGVQHPNGRWPANLILDAESAAVLDELSGERTSGSRQSGDYGMMGFHGNGVKPMPTIDGDSGGASRYFFIAKPDSESRLFYTAKASRAERTQGGASGKHPTQKPIDLMQWLVKLICPPNGTVLDPFAGSGTTGVAADREGLHSILIEQDASYAEDARRKIIGDCPLFAEVTTT